MEFFLPRGVFPGIFFFFFFFDPFSDFPHPFSDLIFQLNAPQESQAQRKSVSRCKTVYRNNILRSLVLFLFFSIKLGDLPLMYPVILV